MLFKLLQIGALLLLLTGTWLLAFGLRVRSVRENDLKNEDKGHNPPAHGRQRPALFWVGLGLITAGAVVEIVVLACT